MDKSAKRECLTVIVPITKMAGKMQNLRSWLNQIETLECEVIVVHDKQDVDTARELEQLRADLNSTKIYFLEGLFGSPGLARNYGKKFATGTHVMFCDSDDVVEILNVVKAIAENPNTPVIIGGYEEINSKSTHQKIEHLAPRNLLQLAKSPGIWRFVFKAEAIVKTDFPNDFMGEDQIFLGQVGIFSNEIVRVKESFYQYFTNNPSQVTSQKNRTFELEAVLLRLQKLKVSHTEMNKTLVDLFIVKNCITIMKNISKFNSDSKVVLLIKVSKHLFETLITLNWNVALKFPGSLK
jgi:glycosyltransferase involved in cell wall biosynthesis